MPTTDRSGSDRAEGAAGPDGSTASEGPHSGGPGRGRRWLWFVGLWAAGVAAMAALGYLPRLILGA